MSDDLRAMRDPFAITGPTCISFSGGRTSAYMLWRVLQSNGGLPPEAIVAFANTGKEEEATLRFVRDCSERWNVPITWVEYRTDKPGFAIVDFDTASRNGEPFEALIKKRNYLPNVFARFCTVELKIRAMHKYLGSLGWKDGDGWDQMIGIRADEQRRVAKIRARPSPETNKETMIMPLADAAVTVADVERFWSQQSFRLELASHNGRTYAGNCDLCFLKPVHMIKSLIAAAPEKAIWWAKMENIVESAAMTKTDGGARFRTDRPKYSDLAKNAVAQSDMLGHDDEGIPCFCGE
jgi:3'-phosphoadenosine 5'-phosphosulfate sulfotransferase (PAPS reductase)/FAD synthetase